MSFCFLTFQAQTVSQRDSTKNPANTNVRSSKKHSSQVYHREDSLAKVKPDNTRVKKSNGTSKPVMAFPPDSSGTKFPKSHLKKDTVY
jgi:hypothetical protein